MEEEREEPLFGKEYDQFNEDQMNEPSELTGKNQTGVNAPSHKGNFNKIDELKEYQEHHHQTELNKSNKKTKTKHKNSEIGNSSSENLPKILKKKTSRLDTSKIEETKKKKKTKTKMDIGFKHQTEINKDQKSKMYEMFSNENMLVNEDYYNVYDQKTSENGDLFNTMDDEDPNAFVNKMKPAYTSTLNHEIPESLNMFISENQ